MVRRLLSNLLSNAINYSREGAEISTIIWEVNDMALIKIIDTGPGIPAEHLPYLVQRFYQGDQARSHSKGTGLGLAIAL